MLMNPPFFAKWEDVVAKKDILSGYEGEYGIAILDFPNALEITPGVLDQLLMIARSFMEIMPYQDPPENKDIPEPLLNALFCFLKDPKLPDLEPRTEGECEGDPDFDDLPELVD